MVANDPTAKRSSSKRIIPVEDSARLLYCELMYKETRDPALALEYIALCGMDELPAPVWATEAVYNAWCAVGYGKAKTFDQAFGFKKKPANARPREKAIQTAEQVSALMSAGHTKHAAFEKVAGKEGNQGRGSVDTVERLFKDGMKLRKRDSLKIKETNLLEELKKTLLMGRSIEEIVEHLRVAEMKMK